MSTYVPRLKGVVHMYDMSASIIIVYHMIAVIYTVSRVYSIKPKTVAEACGDSLQIITRFKI